MSTPSGRLRGTIAFWALAGLALLASHDAIFLVQLGPGEELVRVLRSAGHDYWSAASAVLASLGLIAGLGVGLRLRALRRRAAALGARPPAPKDFGHRAVRHWASLMAIVALGFVIQESVEHVIVHGHLIGIGALVGQEYPLALPVIATITAVAALIATAVAGVERALVAAIADAMVRPRQRATPDLRRESLSTIPHHLSILSHTGASRAPPSMLPT